MTEFTDNLHLAKPNFNHSPWHDDVNKNFDIIDAVFTSAFDIHEIAGIWDNSTAYTIGQRVIDTDSNTVWQVEVDHTSAVVPTTFEEDRTANPTFWSVVELGVAFRGEWLAATNYRIGDLVYSTTEAVAGFAEEDHTSTANIRDDITAGKLSVIVDLKPAITAAATSEANAAASAAAAAAAASTAAGSAASVATRNIVPTLAIPPEVSFFRTAGYDTVDDGGGAVYSDVNNGAQGQVTDNSGVPRTFYITNKKLTPRMYGAKSNGTDSLAAFQAWAADVSAGIGWGSIDAEPYHVSNDIAFTGSKIVIENNGTITQTGTAKKTLKFTSVEGVRLFGGSLVGKGTEYNGASSSFNGAAGIYLDACSDVHIESVNLSNHAGGGLRWINGLDRAILSNIISKGVGSGIIASGDNGNDVGIGGLSGVGDQAISVIAPIVYDHAFGLFAFACTDLHILDPIIYDIPGQHGIYLADVQSYTVNGGRISNTALDGIKSQIAQDNDLTGPCVMSSVLLSDIGQHGINVDTIPTFTDTRRHADVRLSNITVRNSTGIGVSVAETTRLSADSIDVTDGGSYGCFMDKVGGSLVNYSSERTDLSGLYLSSSMSDMNGLHLQNIRLIDAVLNTVAGASPQHVYAMYADVQDTTFSLTIDGLEIDFTGSEPASFSKAFRLQTNVVADVRRLTDRTTKGWQIATVPSHFDQHVSNAGETTSAVLNPSTPISGFARRKFYGTQDPASAGMTRAFNAGDICWNATPIARGVAGWLCTVAGSPGTWVPFGETPTLQTIATNADFSLNPASSPRETLHTGTLTADRAVTLVTTGAQKGQSFRITRTGSGLFNLNVGSGPLAAMKPFDVAEFIFDGTAWYLASHSEIPAEGTWTPAITFGGASVGMTFSAQQGLWARQGRLFYHQFNITLSAKGSSVGTALLTGLPLVVSNGFGSLKSYGNMVGLTGAPHLDPQSGSSSVALKQTAATGTPALTDANFSNTSNLTGGFWVRI